MSSGLVGERFFFFFSFLQIFKNVVRKVYQMRHAYNLAKINYYFFSKLSQFENHKFII